MGRGPNPAHDQRSRVSIVKGISIAQNGVKAIKLLGGLKTIIQLGSRVLIKPNLGVALPASTGVTTEPKVISTLVQLAREAGAKKVWVGERMDFQFQGKWFFIGNCAIRSNRGRKGIEIEGCPPPGFWIQQGFTSAETS